MSSSMAYSLTLLALLSVSGVQATRFGAAGHKKIEYLALGSIPPALETCPNLSEGRLFSSADRLLIYHGNWARDFSQIIDPVGVACLPGETTDDCLGRQTGKVGMFDFVKTEKWAAKQVERVDSLTASAPNDNKLQKGLKSFIRKGASKYFEWAGSAAKFAKLALKNRLSREALTRVGQVLWEAKLEKLVEDHPEKYGELLLDDDTHNALFITRNIKGADGQDWAIGKFCVTSDTFGLYRLEEHIDNPDEYPSGQDKDWDFDSGCDDIKAGDSPAGCSRVNIDPKTNMKSFFKASLAYAANEFKMMTFCGQSQVLAKKEGRLRDADLWKAEKLRHFGNALHTMEDFFAHSNWMELALRAYIEKLAAAETDPEKKKRLLSVRPTPWTGSYNGRYPLVTGKFAATDIMGSMLGIFDDRHHKKAKQTTGDKVEATMPETCAKTRTHPLLLVEKLGLLIGGDLLRGMADTPESKESAWKLNEAMQVAVGPSFDGAGDSATPDTSSLVSLMEEQARIRHSATARDGQSAWLSDEEQGQLREKVSNVWDEMTVQVKDENLKKELKQWLPFIKAYCTLSMAGDVARIFLSAAKKAVAALRATVRKIIPSIRDVSGWLGFMQNWIHMVTFVQEGSNFGAMAEALKFYQWSSMDWLPEGAGEESQSQRSQVLAEWKSKYGWDELKTISLHYSNPTHTQLSKDKEHHPMYSLAQAVAEFFVRLMGQEFIKREKEEWKTTVEGEVSAFRFRSRRIELHRHRKTHEDQSDKILLEVHAGAGFKDTMPFILNTPGLSGSGKKARSPVRTIGPDSTGPDVKLLQKKLNEIVSTLGEKKIKEDNYGPFTERVVRKYQMKHGLPNTGVCNAHTWVHILGGNPKELHAKMHIEPTTAKMGPFTKLMHQLFKHPRDFDVAGADKKFKCAFDLMESWVDYQLSGAASPTKTSKTIWTALSGGQKGALELMSTYTEQDHRLMKEYLNKVRDGLEELKDRSIEFAQTMKKVVVTSKVTRKAIRKFDQIFDPSSLAESLADAPCKKFLANPMAKNVAQVYKVLVEDDKNLEVVQDAFKSLFDKKGAEKKSAGLAKIFQCLSGAGSVQVDPKKASKKLWGLLVGLGLKYKPDGKDEKPADAKAKLATAKQVYEIADGTRAALDKKHQVRTGPNSAQELLRSGVRFIGKEFPETNVENKRKKVQVMTYLRLTVAHSSSAFNVKIPIASEGWTPELYEWAVDNDPNYKCGSTFLGPFEQEIVVKLIEVGHLETARKHFSCMSCEDVNSLVALVSAVDKGFLEKFIKLGSKPFKMPGDKEKWKVMLLKCGFVLDAKDVDSAIVGEVAKGDLKCSDIQRYTAPVWQRMVDHELELIDTDGAVYGEFATCCLTKKMYKTHLTGKYSKSKMISRLDKKWKQTFKRNNVLSSILQTNSRKRRWFDRRHQRLERVMMDEDMDDSTREGTCQVLLEQARHAVKTAG